jgi:hypothetical protein
MQLWKQASPKSAEAKGQKLLSILEGNLPYLVYHFKFQSHPETPE